jgi:hypothetical protein
VREDEEAAAMLLSSDDEAGGEGTGGTKEQEVPTGVTMLQIPALGSGGRDGAEGKPLGRVGETEPGGTEVRQARGGDKKASSSEAKGPDTATLAKAILDKYLLRPRNKT